MRFDETAKSFEVSVRELAEDEGFRRVGFDRGDGWRRLGVGSEVHAYLRHAARFIPLTAARFISRRGFPWRIGPRF
jgi:hypothetical protein